jgi:tetratricopeptide (TPR) repeat protein
MAGPKQWLQNSRGRVRGAFLRLGECESGTVRLEQAVEAYQAALLEQTRERVPLDWASTQHNLGNALARIGDRESNTTRLELAVEAYKAALLELTVETAASWHEAAQSNLAHCLAALKHHRAHQAGAIRRFLHNRLQRKW